MEKLTLNKAWSESLRMAKNNKDKTGTKCISDLKHDWLLEHGYKNDWLLENVKDDCFFCEYDKQQRVGSGIKELKDILANKPDCLFCPGKLVSKRFDCCNTNYHYAHQPQKFYEKLVELNKRRVE